MVTQRIANPFIPVRFWAWPPKKFSCFILLKKVCSHHSSVAQLVEQLTVNQLVAGSSPARGANYPTFSNFEVLLKICKILSFWDLDNDENVLLKKE